jgi:hypothetical protein
MAAKAIRDAGRTLELSIYGINAWTRFKIDIRIEGHRRIVEMREAGELAEHGENRKSSSAMCSLKDLIGSRAQQRAHQWERQAGLIDSHGGGDPASRSGTLVLKDLSASVLASVRISGNGKRPGPERLS